MIVPIKPRATPSGLIIINVRSLFDILIIGIETNGTSRIFRSNILLNNNNKRFMFGPDWESFGVLMRNHFLVKPYSDGGAVGFRSINSCRLVNVVVGVVVVNLVKVKIHLMYFVLHKPPHMMVDYPSLQYVEDNYDHMKESTVIVDSIVNVDFVDYYDHHVHHHSYHYYGSYSLNYDISKRRNMPSLWWTNTKPLTQKEEEEEEEEEEVNEVISEKLNKCRFNELIFFFVVVVVTTGSFVPSFFLFCLFVLLVLEFKYLTGWANHMAHKFNAFAHQLE
ncbi:hypothetical protein BLOT_010002 [Blomia tropicalis]|nr:hypothetical protein BLOT_010002 [Blomia tropicalis]